ncbi:MAG: flagellar basal body rod C-terminal domain-containing protein [Rhodospirillaceae bacterium]
MALSAVLWTSTSGLQAVQQQLQWRTDNISNAQNATYSRRDAVTTSTGVNSVQVDVARASNNGLQDQFLTSNSLSSFTTTQKTYFQRVGDVLGTAQSTPYLQQAIDSFTGAWKSFETDTSSTTSEANVINTGQALADTVTHIAQNLTQVETEVRSDVGNTVDNLNSKLKQLDSINKQISGEPLDNLLNPSLLDTRDSLVRDISGMVSVVRIVHPDNSVALYTQGGVALIDHGANQFQWNNPSGLAPWLSLVNTTGNKAPSPSLNEEFTGGSLGAALNVLASTNTAMSSTDPTLGVLAKARSQVDNLAVQLAGQEPGTFGGAYYAATADRTTDLIGGIANNTAGAVAAPISAGPPPTGGSGNPMYWGNTYDPAYTDPVTGIVGPAYNPIVGPTTAQFGVAAAAAPLNSNVFPQPAAGNWTPYTTSGGGTWDGTALNSFFTIDNGTAGPPQVAPTLSPSSSFAINPALVNGTATVKRQSATPVIAELTNTGRAMTAAGVTATNQTYSGLASTIANYHAAGQAAVSDNNTRYTQTTQTLDTRLNSEIGVNMDTEMAQLTVLQNAYAANARVINVVQTMFDTLLQIGK